MATSRDFDYSLLDRTAHRPWPLPARPWIMTQSWHELLFAHWPVDKALLRRKVPAALALDEFDGQAWLGIVPFRMSNVSPRGVPALPRISAFAELNVRTYVSAQGKPGVYFFSLDAASALAVAVARTFFHLPYFSAAMTVETRDPWIEYESRRASAPPDRAAFVARYRPRGAVRPAAAGSLEHFLTERYCLYTLDRSGRACRLDIHHGLWPLQPAEAGIRVNTMADAAGIPLPAVPPILHFSRRLDVVAWPMERL